MIVSKYTTLTKGTDTLASPNHLPIELPDLAITLFETVSANVSVIHPLKDQEHPVLYLEGDEDAFTHSFEGGILRVSENRGENFSVANGGGHTIITGGSVVGNVVVRNGTVRINGMTINSDRSSSVITGSVSNPRNATLSIPAGHSATHAIETVSGDVLIDGLSARAIRVASISGDIAVRNTDIELAGLKSVSGDVELVSVTSTGEVLARTTSGDIDVKDSTAESWKLKSVSGDVTTRNTTGTMNTRTVSGRKRTY